jgi:flagellar L-ring protein precursor FlgH
MLLLDVRYLMIFIGLLYLCWVSQGQAKVGSLWQQSTARSNMFADKTAHDIGDIVTVIVQESAEISASKASDTNKSTNVSDTISKFLNATVEKLPGFAWDASSDFAGGGNMSDSQSAESQLSLLVVDRLPNGNLVIEGMRRVTMANEINYAVVRGYIRPKDITASNTILSSRIADAQVDFIAEGSLTEAQRKGWLSRFHDFVNPF